MMARRTPFILIIDDMDEARALRADLQGRNLAQVRHRHPQDVELEDLRKADLVLVDYELKQWPERDDIDRVSLKPVDGLALAGILRQHIYGSVEKTISSPTAFAIYTARMKTLSSPLPPENREHIIAHMNNLEWVFPKGPKAAPEKNSDQIAGLGAAVIALPNSWPADHRGQVALLCSLLRLPDNKQYAARLIGDVEMCLPPIHELSECTHGHAVLRWLLHRILPYPCFLWDTLRLAARLRIDHSDLCTAIEVGKPLSKKLGLHEYKGILSRFRGRRWWRASIEQFLWDETKGNSADINRVQEVIRKYAKKRLKPSEPNDYPVVCLDENYSSLDRQFYSTEESVRIRPDDWPAYADQAWVTIELAKSEPKLKALVIQEDLGKIT
jgi:hypothetical protein